MDTAHITNQTSVYSFKGFIYRQDQQGSDTSWAGTLLDDGVRIARVSYDAANDEFDIDPIDETRYNAFVEHAVDWASSACTDLSDEADAAFSLLTHLADVAYHLRRLEVISKRHATFQLRSDPPGRYRYIRGLPLTLELARRLRGHYRDDLVCIFREEELATSQAA